MSRTRRVSLKKRYAFSGKRSRNVGGNTAPVSDMIARGTHGDMAANGHVVTLDTELCKAAGTPAARDGQPLPIVLTHSAYAAWVTPGTDPETARARLLNLLTNFAEAVRRHTGPRTGVLDFVAPFMRPGAGAAPAFRAVATGRTIAIALPPTR